MDGGDSCIVRKHLMPFNVHFKMTYMINFMLCIFYHNNFSKAVIRPQRAALSPTYVDPCSSRSFSTSESDLSTILKVHMTHKLSLSVQPLCFLLINQVHIK